MIVLTDEAVQQIEDVLWTLEQHNKLYYGETHNTVIEANKALATIRAARAQTQVEQKPIGYVQYFGDKLCFRETAKNGWHPVFLNIVSVESVKREPIGMIMGGELVGLVKEYKTGAWPIYANPIESVQQESYIDVVSHWHYWQKKADEYQLQLRNLQTKYNDLIYNGKLDPRNNIDTNKGKK